MTSPFGPGPLTVLRRPAVLSGSDDLARVLAAAGPGPATGRVATGAPVLLLGRCRPTAAFSRRDTLSPGHPEAATAARRHGFEPVVRPVGGHLAGYDEGALVVHLWGAHAEPRADLRRRFEVVGAAVADALAGVGVPGVRVGPVPGEYCDGAWSVNAGGRVKLAGTGQRLFRRGYLVSAVVCVLRCDAARAMLVEAYGHLGLPLDPDTVGAVEDTVPGVGLDDVREAVAASLSRAVSGASGVARRDPAVTAAGAGVSA